MTDETRDEIDEGRSESASGVPSDPVGGADSNVEESVTTSPSRPPTGRRKRSPFRRAAEPETRSLLTAEERFLVLDAWKRPGLVASELVKIAQISSHTLVAWRRRLEEMVRRDCRTTRG